MKWGKSFTNPALLAGLWVFLSMQEVLDRYSSEELAALQETAQNFLMCLVEMPMLSGGGSFRRFFTFPIK